MNPLQSPNTGVGKKLCFEGRQENNLMLRDVLPLNSFFNKLPSKISKLLNIEIAESFNGEEKPFPNKNKNIERWWLLENGSAVGYSEDKEKGYVYFVSKI